MLQARFNLDITNVERMAMYQSNRSLNIPPSPPGIYPGHLTSFPAQEGGNLMHLVFPRVGHLITTHRGWGIWSLASILCYESRWFHVACSAFNKTRLPPELRRVLSCESPAVFLHTPLEEKWPWGPFHQLRRVLAISFPEPTCLLVSTKTRSSGIINFQRPRF